jgi:hypothetical protein
MVVLLTTFWNGNSWNSYVFVWRVPTVVTSSIAHLVATVWPPLPILTHSPSLRPCTNYNTSKRFWTYTFSSGSLVSEYYHVKWYGNFDYQSSAKNFINLNFVWRFKELISGVVITIMTTFIKIIIRVSKNRTRVRMQHSTSLIKVSSEVNSCLIKAYIVKTNLYTWRWPIRAKHVVISAIKRRRGNINQSCT